MPSSVVLLAGVGSVVVGIGLLRATARVRHRLDAASRLLHRAAVVSDEVERVDRARRELGDGVALARGSASGVNDMVRWSGKTVTGIPYAILAGIARFRKGGDGS